MAFISFFRYFKERWGSPNGYREVLTLAFPLILSTGSWSIQGFVDRMFLTWYSPDAIAAAMPAGILNFTIMSLFIGTASYVSTFIAQYYGAKRYDRIGSVVWQGLYISFIGGAILLVFIPFAGHFFSMIGHAKLVCEYETVYFRILCLGAIPAIASSALSGFFAGRGDVWPVVWVNLLATLINIVLDYFFIFGHFGFPEMGIGGAAIATDLSALFGFCAFFFLMCRKENNHQYQILRGWKFDSELFWRIMRYGLPSGIQFFLDFAGFALFILLMGRLGVEALAATNIAFNINTLAFMPMIGVGIAISILVGQNLGKDDAPAAERSVYSGFHITFLYMGTIALAYVVVPGLFLMPFAAGSDPASFGAMYGVIVVLMRFVAVYSLFDTMNIVFASALKGAGDTRFVMFMIMGISAGVLVIPSYIALVILNANIYIGWTIASAYVCLLGLSFYLRFLGGKWKSMRVIEAAPYVLSPAPPGAPCIEREA
jgi:multidrug resistance protein, MATE family